MTVEMSTGRGEAGDIICKTVVRVVQSCIQVWYSVICLLAHVASVRLLCQPTSKCKSNFGLQISMKLLLKCQSIHVTLSMSWQKWLGLPHQTKLPTTEQRWWRPSSRCASPSSPPVLPHRWRGRCGRQEPECEETRGQLHNTRCQESWSRINYITIKKGKYIGESTLINFRSCSKNCLLTAGFGFLSVFFFSFSFFVVSVFLEVLKLESFG